MENIMNEAVNGFNEELTKLGKMLTGTKIDDKERLNSIIKRLDEISNSGASACYDEGVLQPGAVADIKRKIEKIWKQEELKHFTEFSQSIAWGVVYNYCLENGMGEIIPSIGNSGIQRVILFIAHLRATASA